MNVQIEKLMAPVQELAELHIANIEKLVSLQLEGIEEGAKAGIESLKKAVSVKDIDAARNYLAGQTEVVKAAVESATARAKTMAELAQSYQASVKKIVEKSFTIN